jgi:hypothetical protein
VCVFAAAWAARNKKQRPSGEQSQRAVRRGSHSGPPAEGDARLGAQVGRSPSQRSLPLLCCRCCLLPVLCLCCAAVSPLADPPCVSLPDRLSRRLAQPATQQPTRTHTHHTGREQKGRTEGENTGEHSGIRCPVHSLALTFPMGVGRLSCPVLSCPCWTVLRSPSAQQP